MRAIDADRFECVTLQDCTDEFAEGAEYILEKIDEAPTLEVEPVRYAKCDISVRHYFEDEDFGDLRFYATLHCSNCGKKLGEIQWLDCIPNPCESYDDEWKIDPVEFYTVEREKAERQIKEHKFDNYCSECGCRLRKEAK